MLIFKMLFRKLWFSLDDQEPGGSAPEPGQPPPDDGNAPAPTQEPANPPTDFIDFNGVKIPAGDFETAAKEKFKDRFEAYDNREKWQAENTRKAQETAQDRRDAESYRRLMDSRNQPQPQNEYEALKKQFIEENKSFYPDSDPRTLENFLSKQFDWQAKLAGFKAQESLAPIQEREGREFEDRFLKAHPKVVKGSDQYQEIASLIGSGVDADKAYQIVYFDDILKERETDAIKRRDEDAKRKLQASPTRSVQGTTPKPKTFKEAFEQSWAKSGGS